MESRNSLSDDEFDGTINTPAPLTYEDDQLKNSALSRLNTLRKGGHFCDVNIQIGSQSIAAHRAVLACSSVFLYEAFGDEDHGRLQHLKLKNLDYDSFNILVDYVYTGRLEVPADQVKSVYKAAIMLKMEHAAEVCAHFLVEHLTPVTCLGIRNFASSHSDLSLTAKTDEYICNNIDSVLNNGEIIKFPQMQVKVIGVNDLQEFEELQLCHLVVKFFRNFMEEDDDTKLDSLLETPRVLYLRSGSHLVDCMEVTDPTIDNSDIVMDYKKQAKYQKQHCKDVRKSPSVNGSMTGSVDRMMSMDREWNVIATKVVSAKRCTAIAMLDDQLCTVSITFYPQPQCPSSPEGELASVESCEGRPVSPEQTLNLVPLSRMSSARCGAGTVVLGKQLVALGGYDRGECLDSVEVYNLESNTWTDLPPMLHARGRFDVAQINDKLFACGGSDGSKELRTLEMYDPVSAQWTALADMSTSRSSAGVAVLNNKLYVVGGWSGYTGLKRCEMYDPETGKWSAIASLNTGRSQCTVCAFQGKLVAVGGCDAWNSTNSVEMYNPETQKWTFLTPMASNRRGAGAAAFKDKLYVIGGSDGQSSLTSVEVYNPATTSWTLGPPLETPRANVAAVVLDDKIFAVGGFSGKLFLDTIEYLSEENWEWNSYLPPMVVHSSDEDSGINGGLNGDLKSMTKSGNHRLVNGCGDCGDIDEGINGHEICNGIGKPNEIDKAFPNKGKKGVVDSEELENKLEQVKLEQGSFQNGSTE